MLDWDDLRFFLYAARHRNLSAAAKELRVAQSTVGRRLASLEASLGVRLLDRTPDGYVLTRAGDVVLAKAEQLEAEALSLERDVGGRDTHMAGLVRVTCAEGLASEIIAPCLAVLHQKHPEIMVELLPGARELSLSMRETDISVRLTQSNQHDLVIRRVGTLSFGLYASLDYLERHGFPDIEGGCSGHYFVTQLDDLQDSEQTVWLAALGPRARVSVQTSSHEAAVAATLHGGGIGCLARFRADREPALKRLTVSVPAPNTAVWLVAHKDNRRNVRIRMVLTRISEEVRRLGSRLNPGA